MDLFDFLGDIFDSAVDFRLSGGDGGVWFQRRLANFLLGAANLVSILILAYSIRYVWVVGTILGAIGTLYFGIIDLRYSIWWIREGRHGFDPPWFELFTFRKI